ncbi:pirin family protein [Paenibacillus lemnae]|uniref:Pirin family protein n=1 Tax=Paenibacillus lemnae TaxID=1330551 RepID=A0A848M1B9_PAELE|nr:pirin family protein [Paenibacillus lemnae]NMO94336.1 pirin family protein [Paenibacillus lemnae]
MIQVKPAHDRYAAKSDWLESHFSFSFGPYYDPENIRFGPLRVLNDDIIQPGKGFGIHPHREAEVVSIVLKGQLKHEDSLDNVGILRYGQIQRMTAGTGILHSEFNPSQDEEAHILQLWFIPDQKQLPPSYEESSFDDQQLKNALHPVLSSHPGEQAALIHQDVTLYLSRLDAGNELQFHQQEGRRIYVFLIEGEVLIQNEVTLAQRDEVRITDLHELTLKAKQDAFFLLIDLPGGED